MQHHGQPHPHRGPHPHGPGRRGGRGRGRGRGSRGGRGGVQLTTHDLGTPEWERADWTGSQLSPNGFYRPWLPQPQSPEDVSRGGIVRRAGGAVGGPSDRESEIPATPLASSGPYDPFAAGMGDQGSAGKKSRSKPFRNAEGVLIRKDGRPDMRSVSSANNLRKVHAKKEAERAEMEGRTPTSARSLVPAGSISDDEEGDESLPGSPEGQGQGGEEGGDPSDTQERHRELMSRIFPSGVEDASRSVGERFFPTQEQRVASEAVMKKEPSSEEPLQTEEGHGTEASSQMTDVVMREMSEAQTEDQQRRAEREDTRMATVEEANEEQEQDQREG